MVRTLAEIQAQWREDMYKDKIWVEIPGFSSYEISGTGVVRRVKSKIENKLIANRREATYYLKNDRGDRQRMTKQELMTLAYPDGLHPHL